ncbi:MAG: LemA family protein [Magnetococcus sp. YQC-5]
MAIPGLDDLEHEPLNEERIRRMKSLMRQLYKEEFESKRLRLPPIKGGGAIALFVFVAMILLASTALYNYNMFVTLRERVWSARGHVEAALQRRSNLFANLVNLTLNHAELERELFRHVADVRQDLKKSGTQETTPPPAPPEGKEGKAMDRNAVLAAASSGNLSRLLAVVEQYPNIKSSSTYIDLMTSLMEIEDRIVTQRVEANEEARIYNTLISSFPWYLLARFTGFDQEVYYLAEARNDGIPSLEADFFKRLLPPGAPGSSREEGPPSTGPAKD